MDCFDIPGALPDAPDDTSSSSSSALAADTSIHCGEAMRRRGGLSLAALEQVGPKRRRLERDEDILEAVRRAETVEGTLAQRLTQYVERIDTDMVRPGLSTRVSVLVSAEEILPQR